MSLVALYHSARNAYAAFRPATRPIDPEDEVVITACAAAVCVLAVLLLLESFA